MNYLQENKDRIVNQLPKLSSEEKEEVKRYFNSHANFENQVDWNKSNWENLTFEYFIQNFINNPSKTSVKKAVKTSGIKGLTEGKDYILVYRGEYFRYADSLQKEDGNKEYTGIIEGYIPLSWEAAQRIASKNIGSDQVEGKWCIAWQKNRKYWDYHANTSFFVIFVDYHDRGPSTNELDWGKEVLQITYFKGMTEVWNRYDNKEEEPHPINITDCIFYQGRTNLPVNLYDTEILSDFIEKSISKLDDCGGVTKSIGAYQIQYKVTVGKSIDYSNNEIECLGETTYLDGSIIAGTYIHDPRKKNNKISITNKLRDDTFTICCDLIRVKSLGLGLVFQGSTGDFFEKVQQKINEICTEVNEYDSEDREVKQVLEGLLPEYGSIYLVEEFTQPLLHIINNKNINFMLMQSEVVGNIHFILRGLQNNKNFRNLPSLILNNNYRHLLVNTAFVGEPLIENVKYIKVFTDLVEKLKTQCNTRVNDIEIDSSFVTRLV